MKKAALVSLFLFGVITLQAGNVPDLPEGKAWKSENKTVKAGKNISKPIVDGMAVICGNKRLDMLPNGKIRITSNGKLLGELYNYQALENLKTHKIDWKSHSRTYSKVKFEAGKFVWDLQYEIGEKHWDSAIQTLEIMDDGKLKISFTAIPPADRDWNLRKGSSSFWLVLPENQANGNEMKYNGKSYILDIKSTSILSDWKSEMFSYQLYSSSIEDNFIFQTSRKEASGTNIRGYASIHHFRLSLEFRGLKGTVYLDLSNSPKLKQSAHSRGGIDFKAVENLEMPEIGKNRILNNSFEQGIYGYRLKHINRDRQWGWTPFFVTDKEAFHGKYALELVARPLKDDIPRRLKYGVNITTAVVPAEAGTYTFSFYAKSSGNCEYLNFWIPNMMTGSVYAQFDRAGGGSFKLTNQWKRYSATFNIPWNAPVEIHFNTGSNSTENQKVWVDALQLEKSPVATVYQPKATEGRLLTSSPDNFISAACKINGKLAISSSMINQSGVAEITVKNFYGEELFRKNIPFIIDPKGNSEIPLPLDTLPGKGIFVIKAKYSFPGRAPSYEFHRYARMDFMAGKHRLKHIFSNNYSSPENGFNYLTLLERYRKLGIGSKWHHYSYDQEVWRSEEKYGITPFAAFMMSIIRDKNRKVCGFAIAEKWGNDLSSEDKNLLVRDYFLDSNGTITPEYLAKFQKAAKTVAQANPSVKVWILDGEVSAKLPYSWWSKEGTLDKFCEIYAELSKAFAAGVKEGNPNAKVCPFDPNNMRPEGGIAEIDRFLYHSNKIGAPKYDVIAIHPYRYSPEDPDLESDAKLLFKVMEKHGYGNIPVAWSEMMHWGPFNIPVWGTNSSNYVSLPYTWHGGLLSYDMGWTEKKSAAWYARAYLVALRHSDKVINATSGDMRNNFAMDVNMTPYAPQMVYNTLSNLLGDSCFKTDIRFAPYIRAYVFSDAENRPVAAVWSHFPKMDNGETNAFVVEIDFKDTLQGVYDMSNSPRRFTAGKFRFPVSSFPVFLRGKPGTADAMIDGLKNGKLLLGNGIAPLKISVFPSGRNTVEVKLKNYLSKPFEFTVDGHGSKKHTIAPNGNGKIDVIMKEPIYADKITPARGNFEIVDLSGGRYPCNFSFNSFIIGKISNEINDIKSVNWQDLPVITIPYKSGNTSTSGTFKAGWNQSGIALEVTVNDPEFVHVDYSDISKRWKNDCLQFFFDTVADGRSKPASGLDDNDYSYALFPAKNGNAPFIWRYHVVDGQLGLGANAPGPNTIAQDIPCGFSSSNGKLVYRCFIPAKYLLPLVLKKGSVFGFGLYGSNSDKPGIDSGGITTSEDGTSASMKPAMWPIAILE